MALTSGELVSVDGIEARFPVDPGSGFCFGWWLGVSDAYSLNETADAVERLGWLIEIMVLQLLWYLLTIAAEIRERWVPRKSPPRTHPTLLWNVLMVVGFCSGDIGK